MSSIDQRIMSALDTIAHGETSDSFRDTVWAVVAHIFRNLIQYRPKGAVVATNSWLGTATGFKPDRCGAAVRRAVELGALTDETDTDMGRYVRDKSTADVPDNARVVSLGPTPTSSHPNPGEGTSQSGGTPTSSPSKVGVGTSQSGGANPGVGYSERSTAEGFLTTKDSKVGDNDMTLHVISPGRVDEGGPPDESTRPGEGNHNHHDHFTSERSAHSELEVKGWLMSMEMESPVWRRPNTPGAVKAATGPGGMRLYGQLLRCPTAVRPTELAALSNMSVKKVRSLLSSFKRVGLAVHTPDGWTVGPVRPSEVTADCQPSPAVSNPEPERSSERVPTEDDDEDEPEPSHETMARITALLDGEPTPEPIEDDDMISHGLEPVPGTNGVIGWDSRTGTEVYDPSAVESFVRPVIRAGRPDITQLVRYTDRGQTKSVPASAIRQDVYGMEWAIFWEQGAIAA